MGKHNNQNFVAIPHARFIDMLTYKASLVGIQVEVQEESYTSKASFLGLDTIGRHFSGSFFVVLIDLVGILSFFSAALAIINGGARILYTVGRDGLLPEWTARLHPTRGTPVGSVTALCVFGLIVGIVLGFLMTPIGAFGFLGTLDALLVLIIYALVCIAGIRFFWRKRRESFRLWHHGIVPALGTLLILGIFVLIMVAPAVPPLNLLPFILIAWLLVGMGLLFVLRRSDLFMSR